MKKPWWFFVLNNKSSLYNICIQIDTFLTRPNEMQSEKKILSIFDQLINTWCMSHKTVAMIANVIFITVNPLG